MKREDIHLRQAARRGDAQACLSMAQRLFEGTGGFTRNYTLGLAYLQQELHKKNGAALLLLGDAVPLDFILGQQLLPQLRDAADMGSCPAMLKLGILLSLQIQTRHEGSRLLAKSGLADDRAVDLDWNDPAATAAFLKGLAPEVVNAVELVLWCARSALDDKCVTRGCYFIAMATGLMDFDPRLAEIVFRAVRLAARSDTTLDLPVDLVEYSLQACSAGGEVEAQYGLGRAFAGKSYGQVPPQRIVRSGNFDKAAALLLRAADAGRCQAWLDLSEIVPGHRSALSSKGIARFFLEKAARAGVLEAQTKLGATLLTEATALVDAEEGIKWLGLAAEQSCARALDLLRTLVLPMPELPPDYERTMLQRIAAMDPELGVRVSLARSLHLTRREAMNFNAKRDIKPWGLLIPGASYENPKGRLAPVVSPEMRSQLQRASEFFAHSSPIENSLLLQRNRVQRHVFNSLSISESLFFAREIGRSLSHYGYGRHWARRSAPVLSGMLQVSKERAYQVNEA